MYACHADNCNFNMELFYLRLVAIISAHKIRISLLSSKHKTQVKRYVYISEYVI